MNTDPVYKQIEDEFHRHLVDCHDSKRAHFDLNYPMVSKRDDTFRRVFERINPDALEQCLAKWLQSMLGSIVGEIIPIDGKSVRGYYDRN